MGASVSIGKYAEALYRLTHLELRELEAAAETNKVSYSHILKRESIELTCTRGRHRGTSSCKLQFNRKLVRDVTRIDVQVRVDPRDFRVGNGVRQAIEPALRLPLERIFAPDRLVAVGRVDAYDNGGVLRDEDLADLRTVDPGDRLRQREHGVLPSPAVCQHNKTWERRYEKAYSRKTDVIGGCLKRAIGEKVQNGGKNRDLHAQGLPADRVQIGQRHQRIVVDVFEPSVRCLHDLLTKLVLYLRMFREKRKCHGQRV